LAENARLKLRYWENAGLNEADQPLSGVRVLLVEDEALVAMLIEDMLADDGCSVVATASRLSEALSYAQDPAFAFDVAILDLNLAGESTFPVASALKARNLPFAFATGYGAGGIPAEWRDRPTLQKPFNAGDVTQAMKAALGRA
jgi:CheY-like chemotaxis protein